MSRLRPLRLLCLVLFAAAALPACGCVPGVGWLPDGSGFVYTAGGEQQSDRTKLMFFDVATKQAKVLAKDTKAPTLWPAVSPDGKVIALARLIGEKKLSKIQVVLLDRTGKEVKRSKEFDWRKVDDQAGYTLVGRLEPQVFWAPQGGHLVLFSNRTTGVYDVAQDSLQMFEEAFLLVFGDTPFRPDGKFLVVTGKDKDTFYQLIDRKGKREDITLPAGFLEAKATDNEMSAVAKQLLLYAPAEADSAWEKDVARAAMGHTLLRIDTGKKTATAEQVQPQKTDAGELIFRQYKLQGGATLRMVRLPMAKDVERRLELLTGGKKKVLVPKLDSCLILPSPTGRIVALRCSLPGDGLGPSRERILVVTAKGEVIGDLEAR